MKMKSLETEQKVSKVLQPYEPKHFSICNRNGIKIYYKPLNNYSGKIVIEDNGTFKFGTEIYKDQSQKFYKTDKLWWKVVEKLYTQEYNKLPEHLKVEHPVMIEFEITVIINGKEVQIV